MPANVKIQSMKTHSAVNWGIRMHFKTVETI